jgi:hypothetical protein
MSRLRFVMPLFALGLLSGGFLLGEDKKAEKELIIIRGQLPRYFKQLGLSDKQKKDVYLIQDKYAKEVKKLNEQIAALKEQGKVDMENVLTAGQKARLRELQSGKKEK